MITRSEFEFLMYATVANYLDISLEDSANVPSIVFTARRVAKNYLTLNATTMSSDTSKRIKELEDDKARAILDNEISFLVFGMELIRLLEPIQIKQQKLERFMANYTISMLKLKREDSKEYQDKKELIKLSRKTAIELFEFWQSKVSK